MFAIHGFHIAVFMSDYCAEGHVCASAASPSAGRKTIATCLQYRGFTLQDVCLATLLNVMCVLLQIPPMPEKKQKLVTKPPAKQALAEIENKLKENETAKANAAKG
jgi:hypothetical protein